MIYEVDKENYQEEVEKSTGLTVVDFWGPSCRPCLALMPAVKELAEKYEGRVKFAKVDSSKNRRLCINLKVMSLPTFIAYFDGSEVERLAGQEVKREDLETLIVKNLEANETA